MARTGTRNRVLSFMSSFSNRDSQSPTPQSPALPPNSLSNIREPFKIEPLQQDNAREASPSVPYNMDGSSSQPRAQRQRSQTASSRPRSMIQTYQPPLMDVSQDTLPELQPIFTFLNSHANKLYQEGYFLKLDDQNTHGRANADRTWTECFAQLVGTVLSLWDAAELDAAGQDGEVLPKFINLTDASIKMIESLPTRSPDEAPLQNVLSISTAGRNRYLLHFNSHHSLVQWTAGIRLAMFEHATLQEAYTGALIAGKGKELNNINIIMERSKAKTEDWARVRFGAGTPWRRCWCVITPPDEKEVQKLQKLVNKKKSAYDRSRGPVLKGDIKFYDTKKTKRTQPIATITDAYSAFAIYPQSKPLIDASTLVKVEGSITIHSNPPSTTEGFVFVMPEVHPAVSGFEMMLRWMFPVFDTFNLYGRPGRLIADTLDPKSLMFAMPKHRRYGYLEILDVTSLIIEQGSANWRESEWRRKMKELTQKRITAIESGSRANSRYSSRRSARNSFGPSRSRVNFDDGASVRSSPSITINQGLPMDAPGNLPRIDSAPSTVAFTPRQIAVAHQRSVSETNGLDHYQENQNPVTNYDGNYEQGPPPPLHTVGVAQPRDGSGLRYMSEIASTPERNSSEDERPARNTPVRELQELQVPTTPEPVAAPPAFAHAPGSLPISKPYHSPELRRANSRMSNGTLHQLAGAGGVAVFNANVVELRSSEDQRRLDVDQYSEDEGQRGVLPAAKTHGSSANQRFEGVVALEKRFSFENPSPPRPLDFNSQLDQYQPLSHFPTTFSNTPRPTSRDSRSSLPPLNTNNSITPKPRTYEPPGIFTSPGPKTQPQIGHTPQTSADYQHLQPLQTRQSIARKPLPARTASLQTPASEDTPSSTGSLANHVLDQEAFNMIGRNNNQQAGLYAESVVHRSNSGISSYDEETADAASTASPDYASTRRSFETEKSKKSVERPRAGVKKTVGNTESNLGQYDSANRASIHIDFGPTINYAALPTRGQSPGPEQSFDMSFPRGVSPGPGMNNYPIDGQKSPAVPDFSGNTRTPSRVNMVPNNAHYRNLSGESRTLAWQPGFAGSGNQAHNQQAITPEQFVAQRAAAAVPMYAHQRQQSSNTVGHNTPIPPLVRNRSSDYLTQQGHSRNSSTDILARPNSRGAIATLGPSGNGNIVSRLSAREQEHVARITGQPLINMAQNNNRQSNPVSGLVGAIEAREQEKQQIKQGINSQAVQNAIAQRQQQAMYDQQSGMMQGGNRNSQFNMPQLNIGQFPSQVQQNYVSPPTNVYAQGGGWPQPSPAYASPEQGRQSPSQYAPRQYFPPQQGGQGRGNTGGYHGHQF